MKRFIVVYPFWLNMESILKDIAWELDVSITIQKESGLLTKIRIEIRGDEERLNKFTAFADELVKNVKTK